MRHPVARVGILVMALAGGCSPLRPKPAHYDYYVLTPIEATTPADSPASQLPVLVIGRVNVAGYLDRDALVTRVTEQQVLYAKDDLWAEPLQEGISRTLRHNLGALLRSRVLVLPQRIATLPEYSVWIDLLRFERVGPREVELSARYSLRAGGALVHSGETHRVESTTDDGPEAAVAGLSRALGRLSRDIAAAVLAAAPAPGSQQPLVKPGAR